MTRTLTLASSGAITTAGLTGSAVTNNEVPTQVGGAAQLPKGVLYLQITKTAGGTFDSTVERCKLQVSGDGGTTWCDLYQNYNDTSPINLFAGSDGSSSLARAWPISVFPKMRLVISGDGSADAWTLDKDCVIKLV